jgi:hypothetical protein
MAYDFTPIVREAINHGGEDPDGIFHWANFAEAVRAEFGLKRAPTCEWCNRVLRDLGQVRRYDGFAIRGCHWQLIEAFAHLPSPDSFLRQF